MPSPSPPVAPMYQHVFGLTPLGAEMNIPTTEPKPPRHRRRGDDAKSEQGAESSSKDREESDPTGEPPKKKNERVNALSGSRSGTRKYGPLTEDKTLT